MTITPADEGTTSIRGIHGEMSDEDRIHRCTSGIPPDQENGSSYWIALVPAPDNAYYGDLNAILQVGIIWCFDNLYPGNVCDDGGENQQWIVWAEGGCNGASPFFQKFSSFSTAPDGVVSFNIYRQTGGSFVVQYSYANESGSFAVSGTNPETSCWLSGTGDNVSAEIACERFDAGDGCGVDTAKVTSQNTKYQNTTGGSWHPTTMNDGDCDVILPGDGSQAFCDVDLVDRVRFWTIQ